MNKECTFENGIVTIKDECGNERKVECCDNLEDILVQENVIETIQNVINGLGDNCHLFSKYRLKDLLCIPTPIIETIGVPYAMMHLSNALNKSVIEGMVYTKFGLMKIEKFLAIFILAFLPVGFHMSKKWYMEYSEEAKCENGRQFALEYLKNILVIQRDKLNAMCEKSVPINVGGYKSYSINDEEMLGILHRDICLYYDIGYNAKEYYKYYTTYGELPEELQKEYNKEEIKIVEELLQKRGKNFVKKEKYKRHK